MSISQARWKLSEIVRALLIVRCFTLRSMMFIVIVLVQVQVLRSPESGTR